jgi:tetraacyldisaccharide 4'-kinase
VNPLVLWITAQWPRRGLGARLMWPLHLLMLSLVTLRRQLYAWGWMRSVRLNVPVLVVGNRVAGGAGKTPTTLAVLEHLQRLGYRPGLLSRGHGRVVPEGPAARAPVVLDALSAPQLSAHHVGDEPWLIWRRTQVPMAIHVKRALAGQTLLHAHPEVDLLVCDDGLQHLALARDIEIVVFDERGAGNGWLLPAGPLREPVGAPTYPGMNVTPLVLYNASAPSTPLPGHLVGKRLAAPQLWSDWLIQCSAMKAVPMASPDTPERLTALRHSPANEVWAISGIAQPERFFEGLRTQGQHFTPCPLADHADLNTLPWPTTARHVLMTEKDAVKIQLERVQTHSPDATLWVVALDFHPEHSFWQALDLRLPPRSGLA